jgi:hypothetical protein
VSAAQPQVSRRRVVSILWFPIFFAIALSVGWQLAYKAGQPHNIAIAAVGNTSQVRTLTGELHRVSANGFEVREVGSAATATAAVRDRSVDAAYVAGAAGTLYVARAASAIRANYLQGVFTQIAAEAHRPPSTVVDVLPLAPGDAGTGIFFFVFPLMMAGLIAAIVLLQLPTWGIGRRAIFVVVVGAVAALAEYLSAVGLHVLPGKPLLLVYAFLLTQVYGQLMVGTAPLLKQYFLPFSLTLSMVLSVPSSGGTVPADLVPGFFRDLSYVLPLAQGVKVTRSVAYFHNTGIAQATLVLGLWAAVAAGAVALASLRQSRARPVSARPAPAPAAPQPVPQAGGGSPSPMAG